MIKECRTREEWQQIVNDFIPSEQSQRAYCEVRNIGYGAFKNWYYKLKIVDSSTKEDGAKARDGELPIITREAVNKEFIGFKLVPSTTKINLPNGINIELTSCDIVGLIQKLLHVA